MGYITMGLDLQPDGLIVVLAGPARQRISIVSEGKVRLHSCIRRTRAAELKPRRPATWA